jgi:hypothetical protein
VIPQLDRLWGRLRPAPFRPREQKQFRQGNNVIRVQMGEKHSSHARWVDGQPRQAGRQTPTCIEKERLFPGDHHDPLHVRGQGHAKRLKNALYQPPLSLRREGSTVYAFVEDRRIERLRLELDAVWSA